MLYIFEDNFAVIKMIVKGRSPTVRHVSRIHGVALEWLYWIKLDFKSQIKYIDTKNQLDDIPTKGNCTSDEWSQLLCLFNNSHLSSINSPKPMSKRTQEDVGEEERVTAKIKADDEFGITILWKGPDRMCLECIWKPGETQIWKSERTSELVQCAANKYGETRHGR